ncbi:MAG: hypothetical protein JOZ78_05925 [Chroococcidiopsidaceae cyanobacterium CP_BM_ER_R8_30]|nr:hypothetical protein [Chroococcidiopsidaceae cyanobacterium CP_BM_ER_R8_30]
MANFNPLHTGAAAFMALAIGAGATAPIIQPAPVLAQQPYRLEVSVPAGTQIPVRYDKQKIVVSPTETVPVTLTVASDVKNDNGRVVIPAGSKIQGKIVPYDQGSRFEAEYLQFPDSSYKQDINAVSRVVNRRETITRGADAKSILTGAAAGGGAATILTAITGGGFKLAPLLGGAAAGAGGGALLGRHKADVNVIYPDRDLTLRLQSNWHPNRRSY